MNLKEFIHIRNKYWTVFKRGSNSTWWFDSNKCFFKVFIRELIKYVRSI